MINPEPTFIKNNINLYLYKQKEKWNFIDDYIINTSYYYNEEPLNIEIRFINKYDVHFNDNKMKLTHQPIKNINKNKLNKYLNYYNKIKEENNLYVMETSELNFQLDINYFLQFIIGYYAIIIIT